MGSLELRFTDLRKSEEEMWVKMRDVSGKLGEELQVLRWLLDIQWSCLIGSWTYELELQGTVGLQL